MGWLLSKYRAFDEAKMKSIPGQFYIGNQAFTAEELLALESGENWLGDLQRVVAFLISDQSELAVPTSGSTGEPKLWAHPRTRLEASARATLDYFGLRPGDWAVLALPARYIGGVMMVVRAWVGGLNLQIVPPSACPEWPEREGGYDFAPLTPAQYIALKEARGATGLGVRQVLLGGSPVPQDWDVPSVEQVFVGYGMTETASHVAVRRLGEAVYRAVGESTFDVDARGALRVDAPHLGLSGLQTNDLVALEGDRAFRYVGRADFTINSGGVKIQPEPVERALEAAGVAGRISYREDERYGQVPVLVVLDDEVVAQARAVLEEFPKRWRPKEFGVVDAFEELASGKLDRGALAQWVKSHPDRLYPI